MRSDATVDGDRPGCDATAERPRRTLPKALLLLAPVVFGLHVAEEAPSFVAWFNSLVEPDISAGLFLTVNLVALLITLAVTASLLASAERAVGLLGLAWFALLFFANAILHLAATWVHQRYSPGAITGATLYIPYFVALFLLVRSRLGVSLPAAVLASLIGAAPMLAHGYLIVFRGSRLF
jgi:hypothetical protein